MDNTQHKTPNSSVTIQLEAFLFWKGEPVTIAELIKVFSLDREALTVALTELETSLSTRGIQLVKNTDTVELRTSPETSELIETYAKDSYKEQLSKAALETLTLILYEGPITRKQIDYVRGVNSQVMIRTLIARGLIERVDTKERGGAYQPTPELLAHVGISSVDQLPEYATYSKDLHEEISTADLSR